MYIVTRNDISLQYQIPQVTHAAIQFANDYPLEQEKWFKESNTVVILAAKDIKQLKQFENSLKEKNIKFSSFYEPDIGNELTAIAIVPSEQSKKLCSKFKLAGK